MSTLAQRQRLLDMVEEAVGSGARLAKACQVIGVAPSTLRRWRPDADTLQQDQRPLATRPIQAKQLSEEEEQRLVEICNSVEFASMAPAQIVPMLADRGVYYASESTIYRVLKKRGMLNHRGRAKVRQKRTPPLTHIAKAINQVWMMDITWLPSRVKGQFFYLYMVEDLYSRFGVHWEVFAEENSEHTCRVIEQSMWREKCLLDPPILHRDNGSTLKSQTVTQKLHEMNIGSSHSRPRVSNDNAFVESLFRTMKYSPRWPSEGFESIEAARAWANAFMTWYNHEHRHSALKFVTPAERHRGEDVAKLANRHAVYENAKATTPARWSGKTRNWEHQAVMSLNPVKEAEAVS